MQGADEPTPPHRTVRARHSPHYLRQLPQHRPPRRSGRAATVIEPPTARQPGQHRPSPDRPPPRNRPVPNRRARPDFHAVPTATNQSNQRWSRQIQSGPATSSRRLLDALDVDGDITTWVDEVGGHIDLEGAELDLLVGSNGETLDALQELTVSPSSVSPSGGCACSRHQRLPRPATRTARSRS